MFKTVVHLDALGALRVTYHQKKMGPGLNTGISLVLAVVCNRALVFVHRESTY